MNWRICISIVTTLGVIAILFGMSLSQVRDGVISSSLTVWSLVAVGLVLLNLVFGKKEQRTFSYVDVAVTTLFVYMMGRAWCSSGVGVVMEHWAIVWMFSIYWMIRIVVVAERERNWVYVALMLAVGYEVWVGAAQLMGWEAPGHGLYRITGTFFNPGPYSCYLAVGAAVAIDYLWKHFSTMETLFEQKRYGVALNHDKGIGIISLMVLILIVVVLPATLSRAAFLAVVVVVGVIVVKRLNWKWILGGGVLLIGAGLFFYYIKQGSADGRLLIWQVSVEAMLENVVWGSGSGSFLSSYGKALPNFFRNRGVETWQEAANVPGYAFNEYLRMGVEYGVIGLLLLLFIVGGAIYGYRRNRSGLLYGLIAFLVFAFFSYPLSLFPYQILFTLLISIGASGIEPIRIKSGYVSMIMGGNLLFLLVLAPLLLKTLKEKEKDLSIFQELKILSLSGGYGYDEKEYRMLYKSLRNDPDYLFAFGKSLHENGKYNESNAILREGTRVSADPMFYNVIGNNYKALGEMYLAQEAYEHAFAMMPNRMYPLYLKFKLYWDVGDSIRARKVASEVMLFIPKIESSATNEMKNEAQQYLDNQR